MVSVRKIRRYAAYFHGWATAFGNHDKHLDEKRDLAWLLGEDQIGLILTSKVEAFLRPLFLSNHTTDPPPVTLGPGKIRIADTVIRFGTEDQQASAAVMDLLADSGDLHLLQTYHVIYPSGTRILTLSRQSPLALVYREIEPLTLLISDDLGEA